MSRLHRNLTGLSFMSAIALIPLAANAADLIANLPPATSYVPPAAYVDQNIWQGFYAGLNGGYGWSGGNGGAQPQGGFGGGQIGYNFQGGPLVFGLETDFQGGDLSGSIAGTTAGGNAFSGHESVDWFGTARQAGLAFGHALFYGTGGFIRRCAAKRCAARRHFLARAIRGPAGWPGR